jgi:hypothetical protein
MIARSSGGGTDAPEDAGAGDAAVGVRPPAQGIESRIPAARLTALASPLQGRAIGKPKEPCVRLHTAGCTGHAVGTD